MGRAKSKREKDFISSIVAIGCIVCRNCGENDVPAEFHHITSGMNTRDHERGIPLCPLHHRLGGYGVAVHASKKAFALTCGSEADLYEQVLLIIGLSSQRR